MTMQMCKFIYTLKTIEIFEDQYHSAAIVSQANVEADRGMFDGFTFILQIHTKANIVHKNQSEKENQAQKRCGHLKLT